MKLIDYFKKHNIGILELYLTDDFHIFIQNYQNDELCIEVCDKNGDGININCDITLNTYICDIKNIVLNSIIDKLRGF